MPKAAARRQRPSSASLPLPEWLVVAMAAGLPFLGRGLLLDIPSPGVAWGRLVLAVLALGVLAWRPRPQRRSAMTGPLLLLLMAGALSLWPRGAGSVTTTFGQRVPLAYPADFEAGLAELARLALLLLMGQAALRVRRGAVLAGLVTGVALLAVGGLREYLPNLRAGDAGWRVFDGFTNPNQLAFFLVVTAPVVAAALAWVGEDSAVVRWLAANQVRGAAAKLRLVVAGALLMVLAVLGLTGSKGGFLAALASAVTAAVVLARGGRRKPALAALATVGGLILLALLGPLRARFVALVTQADSQRFRLLTWGGTLDLIRAHPLLGCGLGGWPLAYSQFAHGAFTQHAHSDWLGTWAEAGLLGLVALLGLYLGLARDAARQCRAGGHLALGVSGLAAVVAAVVAGLVDSGWSVTAVAGALVLLGAALAPDCEPGAAARRLWPAALAVVVLLGALALGETARANGQRALAAGAPGTAEAAYASARRWVPWSGLAVEEQAGLLAALDRPEQARAAYHQALRRRPTSARARYRLAAAEARWGRLDEAIAQSAAAAALSPLHLQGRLQLGQLLEQANRSADALTVYRELDRVAQTPAMQVHPLQGYQLDIVHAEALMRLAALETNPAAVSDAKARALPDLQAYLATWDRETALLRDADEATRSELMMAKGLTQAEHDKVVKLAEEAAR